LPNGRLIIDASNSPSYSGSGRRRAHRVDSPAAGPRRRCGRRLRQRLLGQQTALLAALFFFNSVGLAVITTQTVERKSVVERYQDEVPDPGVDAGVLQPGGEADVPSGTEGENSGPVSDVPSTPEPSGQEQQN
jgi:hypothetical protein